MLTISIKFVHLGWLGWCWLAVGHFLSIREVPLSRIFLWESVAPENEFRLFGLEREKEAGMEAFPESIKAAFLLAKQRQGRAICASDTCLEGKGDKPLNCAVVSCFRRS